MSATPARRLLIVANLTESTPRLLEEVKRRARSGCDFTVLVPPERHPDAPDWTEEEALELIGRAAHGCRVASVDCGADAAATIGPPPPGGGGASAAGGGAGAATRGARAGGGGGDEILLSTPTDHHEHGHRHSLPKRIQALDVPVTVMPPDPAGWSASHGFPD